MVSVAHFRADAESILFEIERRLHADGENSEINFIAARTIQKCFRGYITRIYIDSLHCKATTIQKWWRGFLGRTKYEELLKERYKELCRQIYDIRATTIQRCWRGYTVRSKIFSYHRLKSWLEFIKQQNKQLKFSSEKYREQENNASLQHREEEAKDWILYILFKLHHLLRTHQISGIYSLPKTRKLSDIENLLNCLKYKDFMIFYNAYKSDVLQRRAAEIPPYVLQRCKYLAHFEREWYQHKAVHKEPYQEQKIPGDRYTRYETVVVTPKEEYKVELGMCQCSLCMKARKSKC